MKLTDRTGDIVRRAMVKGDETVVMLSTAGQMIRIPVLADQSESAAPPRA